MFGEEVEVWEVELGAEEREGVEVIKEKEEVKERKGKEEGVK